MSNLRRKQHKIGNTTYRGGDKIKPSNDTFAAGTAVIIIVPSLYIMTVVSYGLCGWWGLILSIFYSVSFINVIRILYLCSRTEPGIIPKIKSKKIDYKRSFYVVYKKPD